MPELPSGTVTLLFSDIEGSTRLLHALGERYEEVLAAHRRLLREAFASHAGVEVDTQGDAFFVAFPTAAGAVAAAEEAQRALAAYGWPDDAELRVRMGIHTGEPRPTGEGYVGVDVHRAARIMSAGHGGQVLLSRRTREEVGDGVPVTDLGEHRLKDLSEPEWLFQLGEDGFPPLKSLNNTNLPAEATALIGRERELVDVTERLRRDGVRLVTLTGPGGTGKTRLALRVAAELVESFANGVFVVELAPVSDPALVVRQVAQTIGVRERPGEAIEETLAGELTGKRMLLLLDNLEHVIACAPELGRLLAAAGGLRILATSRERLGLSAEHEYAVPPLVEDEAVELFCARAAQAKPGFALDGDERAVREICMRLDRLPLAIELGAARIRLFSPEVLLARLEQRLPLLTGGARDLPERQRTLRAAIEWSFELLSDEEKRLFARLSVFAGGCTVAAAEDVCDADLDGLSSLVDKSLLRSEEGPGGEQRFTMLETVREYAAERLVRSGEERALRMRHAEHFLALAEEAEPELIGRRQVDWAERLEREHANLRAALAASDELGERSLMLRLAGALARFWHLHSHKAEGVGWLEKALASAPDDRLDARAKAVNGLSMLSFGQGELARAQALAEESVALYRTLGDEWNVAYALNNLANAVSDAGGDAAGWELYEQCAEVARKTGNDWVLGMATVNLGDLALRTGRLEDARRFLDEGLALQEARGEADGACITHLDLGHLALAERRHADAAAHYDAALRLVSELGFTEGMSPCLDGFAALAAEAGDCERAVRLLGASEVVCEVTGAPRQPTERALHARTVATAKERLGEQAFAAAWEEGRALSVSEAVAEVDAMLGERALAQ